MKILLVEDQAMVRGALKALLTLEDDIEVVADCENGLQALRLLAQTPVDIVLTDIEMPEMNGIELSQRLSTNYPQVRKVIVTTFGKAGYIRRSMAVGVQGFLLKDAPSEQLATALRKVMAGKKVIDAELAVSALDDTDPLSEKERKALKLASSGKKTQEIATILCLSESLFSI